MGLGAGIQPAGETDHLRASLEAGADRIAAAVPVARAIVEGKRAMGLAEKMGTLATRMQAVPAALGARADAVLTRLDALEASGTATFSGLEQVVADAEAGVSAAEHAMRQLTNGGG